MGRATGDNNTKTGVSPGRPRNFNSEQIVDRALEIFWKNGFTNTTTRELENELMLNQSSLYNTFGSKEQFFNIVLDRYESRTSEALIVPLEAPDANIDSLKQYFNALTDWMSGEGRRGCMLINLMTDDGLDQSAFMARVSRYRKRVETALYQALQSASELKQISDAENRERALLLIGLTLGLNIAARVSASQNDLDLIRIAIHNQIDNWCAA